MDQFNGRKVALGSIYLSIQNVFTMIIGILGYSFLARAITQEEMGAITGLTLLLSLIQLLSDFGLTSSLAKFVSELKGKGVDVSSHVMSGFLFRLPLSILLFSILYIFSGQISQILFRTDLYSSALRILAFDAFFFCVMPYLNGVLLGLGRLKVIATYGVAYIVIRWASIVIFLLQGYGILGVVLGWICGDVCSFLLNASEVWRLGALTFRINNFRVTLLRILKFSLPLYLSSFVSFLYTWYDKALVLAYLPLQDLGVYNIAYTAYSVLISLASSLGSALFPYYGIAYGRQDHQAISIAIKRAIKYSMLVMFPLALGLFATARPVIMVFAGQQYERGWVVLAILSVFALVYGISPAFSNLLLIYGRTKTILLITFIPVVLSLLTLPLLWSLGLNGLAIMRGASILATFSLSAYLLSRIVKIEVDRMALVRIFSSSVIMSITVMLLEHFYYNEILLPLYVVTGGIVYVAMIRALKVLDADDFGLLTQLVGVKMGKFVQRIML